MTNIILLENELSDVDGDSVTTNIYPKIICVWADDFGGGTVTIQTTPDAGTTWIDIPNSSYTTNTVANISGRIPQGFPIRAKLSGSTSPVNVNAVLYENVG